MRYFNDADATPQAAEVHGSAKLPVVGFLVEDFNGLEICRSIESANSIELTVHDCQSNLM